MAGGGGGASQTKELDETPTWSVSLVCAVIITISILLEKVLHGIGKWFIKRRKEHLLEALEKIKAELMVLGFISLLLTFGQSYITKVCFPAELTEYMLPCKLKEGTHGHDHHVPAADKPHENAADHHRRLLWNNDRRFLAADSERIDCDPGRVPLISIHGLHQLHIFIFFLAVFHVIYSAITMVLGRMKIRCWKQWEREAAESDELHDAQRFRLTHETSFVKDHISFWTKNTFLFYFSCFFRQFARSVRKADYLSMRHGFISVHLAPGTKFNFQKYIKRSLEDDFKVVVGISPVLWTSAVLFLLVNVGGWHAMVWLSLLPLVVILVLGGKLQAIITEMAVEIKERHAVVQGIPLAQVSDRHFWFGWPRLVLHLIHLSLFQNAFTIIYILWTWYEFPSTSCLHDAKIFIALRVFFGAGVQFLCSYITLPLYALVTQMGSTMKRSIFDDQTSKALRQWHKNALRKRNEGRPEHNGPTTRTLGGSPSDSPDISPRTNALSPRQRAKAEASMEIHEEDHRDDRGILRI